jgi:hypothetical protein
MRVQICVVADPYCLSCTYFADLNADRAFGSCTDEGYAQYYGTGRNGGTVTPPRSASGSRIRYSVASALYS